MKKKKILSRAGKRVYDMVGSKSHADMWETIQTLSLWFIAYGLRVGIFLFLFVALSWGYVQVAPNLYALAACLFSSCP